MGTVALRRWAPGRAPVAPPPPPLPFQLSVMLWTVFRKLPFEQRLENVAAAGYRNVELVGEFAHWSDADYTRALAAKRSLGITFDASTFVRHPLADPRQRQAFLADVRASLPVLDRLECPVLILQTGNRIPGMAHVVQYQSCVDGLRQAAKLVEGSSRRILVENIDPLENPRYFLTSGAEGIDIMNAVDHPQVQLLLDFYHEQVAEGNLIAKLNQSLNRIGLVHIADVPGRHQPGTGEINYANIFRRLTELGFPHVAAMEFFPTYDEVACLRAARLFALQSAALANAAPIPTSSDPTLPSSHPAAGA